MSKFNTAMKSLFLQTTNRTLTGPPLVRIPLFPRIFCMYNFSVSITITNTASLYVGAIPVRPLRPPIIGKEFIEMENGLMYMNAVARHQGYAFAIKSHKTKHHWTIRVYLGCSLGYKSKLAAKSVAEKQSTSTKKTGCLFEMSLNYRARLDCWVVSHDCKVVAKLHHNHPAFDQPNNLSLYCRFSPAVLNQISLLSSAGCRANQTRQLIEVKPGSQPLVRDIHNVKSRLRDTWLDGRTPIQGLFDLITESNWAHRTLTAANGTLQNLLFASTTAICLARHFSTVLSLDCTYKTNRFNLPLLHIVGTTNTHRTFTVAMCFLQSKVTAQYEWALTQLKEVIYQNKNANSTVKMPQTFATDAEQALSNAIGMIFPDATHILCVWQININVAKHCKSKFTEPEWTEFMKIWNNFVASDTTVDYNINLDLVTKMAKAHNVFDYLQTTWLHRSKKFVTLFTSSTPHFGNSSTSRVEGSHFRAKRFLEGQNNNFLTCFNSFKRFEEHQMNKIAVLVGIEMTKTLQGMPPFFKELNGVISHFALKKLKSQYNLLPDSLQRPCTHTF